MAFTPKELEIIRYGSNSGKSRMEIEEALSRLRTGMGPKPQPEPQPSNQEKLQSIAVGAGKEALNIPIETAGFIQNVGQRFLALIDPTKSLDEIRAQTGFQSLSDEDVQKLLEAKNEYERTGQIATDVVSLLGGSAPLVRRGIQAGVDAAQKVPSILSSASETPFIAGALQKGKELIQRVPRFLGKVKSSAEESALTAEKLKGAPPAIKSAIESGLDERIINTIQQADEPTIKAYKEMIDIAETGKGTTLKPQQQPSIVAGRVSADQFDLIDKQRQLIGKNIEKAVESLPNTNVNMAPSLNQLRSVLSQNGVNISKDGVLDISGSTLSKQQGVRLQELYDTATRTSGVTSAKTVHGMDRLFSQLQREARFDNLDNIFIKVNGEDVNAFTLFRDIYRNQLDNLSPEIRELNGQYRILRQKVDDIEDTILKTPDFQATKSTDSAEFAKVNLRRLAGEAQSSPAYQAIVEDMDRVARELGYVGPRADDLIYFAQEIRKLYPDTIPPTGFAGGIRTGIADIAQKVLSAGEPTTVDQRKALKMLLESLLKSE